MKRCDRCRREHPIDALVCLPCKRVLEERPAHQRLNAALCAAGVAWIAARLAGIESVTLRRAMYAGLALDALLTVIVKGYQRWRRPGRPVVQELLSVRSDVCERSYDPLLFLGVGAWAAVGLVRMYAGVAVDGAMFAVLVVIIAYRGAMTCAVAWDLKGDYVRVRGTAPYVQRALDRAIVAIRDAHTSAPLTADAHRQLAAGIDACHELSRVSWLGESPDAVAALAAAVDARQPKLSRAAAIALLQQGDPRVADLLAGRD